MQNDGIHLHNVNYYRWNNFAWYSVI